MMLFSNSTSPHSTAVLPFVSKAATVLAWSIADPPPNAITKSTPSSFAICAISSQSAALGLGFTFVPNTAWTPAFSRLSLIAL